jgi:ribonucleoside-triphosphate reductase
LASSAKRIKGEIYKAGGLTMKVVKKDGREVEFQPAKIIEAVHKSANRSMYSMTKDDEDRIISFVKSKIVGKEKVTVPELHIIVENALDSVDAKTAKAYRDYRNYKTDFVAILDSVYKKSKDLEYIGDVSNANTDSTLVATQRSLTFGQLNKELYQKFFLNQAERDAINDGYIYIHDMKDRLSTMNCCLFDIENVLKGGFECANMHYTEPKTLDVAFDVISDITMSSAAQQYGKQNCRSKTYLTLSKGVA